MQRRVDILSAENAQGQARNQGVTLRTQGRERLRTEEKAGRFLPWGPAQKLKLFSLGAN